MYEEVNKPLDISHILEHTKDLALGNKIRHHMIIGSTNSMAYDLGEQGEQHGALVLAEEQSAGKGRMKRKWESARFKGIYLSLLLRPENKASFLPRFTIYSAVSCAKAIMEETGLQAKIKWPNDILIGSKKVAGILTELKTIEDIVKFIIIGIGINVNHLQADFSEETARKSTSLLMETHRPFSRESLIIKLLLIMNHHYCGLFSNDFKKILNEWKMYSPYHENISVTIMDGEKSYRAITRGITKEGELLIEDERGQKKKLSFGELTTFYGE
jgi:BirA family biotin operon repressor/biotin-[acetyl-CoA-carboxylase] ligase